MLRKKLTGIGEVLLERDDDEEQLDRDKALVDHRRRRVREVRRAAHEVHDLVHHELLQNDHDNDEAEQIKDRELPCPYA